MKKYLAIALLIWSVSSFAQDKTVKWAGSIGGSFIRFSDPVAFPGEGVNFQIPNIAFIRYFGKGFSLGAGLSVTGISQIEGFYTNSYDFSFMDIYGRYDFNLSEEKWVPYILSGVGLLVKDKNERAMSFNAGFGLTYWLFPSIGLNGQIVHRALSQKYESYFSSHTQVSGSLIFTFGESTGKRNKRRTGHGFTTY